MRLGGVYETRGDSSPVKDFSRATMAAMGSRCIKLCKSIGLVGAATVELIYENGVFYFSRISAGTSIDQALAEQVTVVDITREQISIALGCPLSIRQKKIRIRGNGMALRLTASSGSKASTVARWRAPSGIGIRVDSHMQDGYGLHMNSHEIAAYLITQALNRDMALAKMLGALAELQCEGVSIDGKLIHDLLSCNEFVTVDVVQKGLANFRTSSAATGLSEIS